MIFQQLQGIRGEDNIFKETALAYQGTQATPQQKSTWMHLRRSPKAPLVTLVARNTTTVNLWEYWCSTWKENESKLKINFQ